MLQLYGESFKLILYSDGSDIEKKSKAIDAKKAIEEQHANDEMLINIKEQDDDFRLLTPQELQEEAQEPPDLPALYWNWTTVLTRLLRSWTRLKGQGVRCVGGSMYGAVRTFMSVYCKCKKCRKTENEVQEAEQTHFETAYGEVDMSVD
ncbi:hypothetical protein AgCh_003518 [Apium graveolens]